MELRDVLPRDAIPSIDDPAFDSTYAGDPTDEVLVVEAAVPRAYPIRILSHHEIVNDVVDGAPIAVTWCPICWSAAVYDRVVDGRTLTFGVSGTLADDALVMYDRETGSEWRQTAGDCIAGDLRGSELTVRPTRRTTWGAFRAANPERVALQPAIGGEAGSEPALSAYDVAPYERYRDGEGFGLHAMRGTGEPRTWPHDDLDPKTPVIGIERDGDATGYPEPRVGEAGGVVADTVGDLDVLVVDNGGQLSAFERPDGLGLAWQDGRLRGDGTTWDPETGESDDGRRLERVPARLLFAFAWIDVHGVDSLYA